MLIVGVYNEMAEPVALLRNVAADLKPNGRIGIVDFKHDGLGPGPALDERADPARVIADAAAAGLRLIKRETFLRYQYMLVFGKAATT